MSGTAVQVSETASHDGDEWRGPASLWLAVPAAYGAVGVLAALVPLAGGLSLDAAVFAAGLFGGALALFGLISLAVLYPMRGWRHVPVGRVTLLLSAVLFAGVIWVACTLAGQHPAMWMFVGAVGGSVLSGIGLVLARGVLVHRPIPTMVCFGVLAVAILGAAIVQTVDALSARG